MTIKQYEIILKGLKAKGYDVEHMTVKSLEREYQRLSDSYES